MNLYPEPRARIGYDLARGIEAFGSSQRITGTCDSQVTEASIGTFAGYPDVVDVYVETVDVELIMRDDVGRETGRERVQAGTNWQTRMRFRSLGALTLAAGTATITASGKWLCRAVELPAPPPEPMAAPAAG